MKPAITKDEMVLMKRLLHYKRYAFELYDAEPRTLDTPHVGSDVVSGNDILTIYFQQHQKDILHILEKVFEAERQ